MAPPAKDNDAVDKLTYTTPKELWDIPFDVLEPLCDGDMRDALAATSQKFNLYREANNSCKKQCDGLLALTLRCDIRERLYRSWKSSSLTVLELKRLGINDDDVAKLVNECATVKSLTSLNLGQNHLSSEGGKAIAEALMVNSILSTLNLADNMLCGVEYGHDTYDALGILAIAEALKSGNGVLTKLDVSYNSIGAEGGKALAEALKGNSVLTSLNLWSNSLGVEGGKAIASAIMANGVLANLNLMGNQIGSEGGKALAAALKVNSVLKSLSVARNDIGGEAAQQLAAAVLSSKSLEVFSMVPIKELREDKLTELNLNSKGLGPTEGIVLAELIEGNSVLTSLSLKYNNLGAEIEIVLQNAVAGRVGFELPLRFI